MSNFHYESYELYCGRGTRKQEMNPRLETCIVCGELMSDHDKDQLKQCWKNFEDMAILVKR